jgi:hypothetical protein
MMTWTEFQQDQPALAHVGRDQFYQHGMGLGFIATVRKDGGPRVHPVCPVISPTGLHVLMFPPPREDDGFAVSGTAAEITDTATWETVRAQVIEDFGELWPNYDTLTLFELSVASCLLTLTQPGDGFPKGPTIWKATAMG